MANRFCLIVTQLNSESCIIATTRRLTQTVNGVRGAVEVRTQGIPIGSRRVELKLQQSNPFTGAVRKPN